ncbi:sister chromatid cohesion protein PDS5 homolog A isoform X5 [Camellia sinensis]|uniref:sister chromatid cohesion protein PDS5 homolog A isoform X5 n=1 Tax=Camellia sinensis TaxID=4442 RepID=UPI00103626B2|nr:sister chromatid cohesion protein PDS5 homolog A isoform X5 [Camellia sinensis]
MAEAEAEAEAAKRLIFDIGKQLAAQKSCPNKDLLVKLLRQAASAFPELDQSASLKPAIKPLSDSIVKHRLLLHKDKDIRLLVAICFCEIIRVLAPNPDLTDAVFKDIFELFVSLFAELADNTSAYFSRRLKVLETVSKLKFCVLMLDTGCEDLVLKMFNTFFTVVREHHPQSLFSAMSSIIALILKEKEKVSQSLIDVILRNILKEGKGASLAASRLAVSVIQNCEEELETRVSEFLTSCIVNRDAVGSELKEFYHEIIFEVFQCAPRMLLVVIPTLTQELLADQVDVRIKAVNLIGKLLALPGYHVAQEYRYLFIEFLKRFSDKSAEVRLGAISCAKAFYMTNPSGTEAVDVLTALEGRLLDFDDRVRTQAVVVACDLARANLKSVPSELITRATERLRDKKVSVRKKALQKLLEVYRDYCTKCSAGIIAPSDHFEQILCGILMLCYDKDCKEFSPQNMELVLAEEMFPTSLSIEDRTRHWILLFSLFEPPHLKALNSILYKKRRLQTEMQVYLTLQKEENNGSEEVHKRIQNSVAKMSSFFPDSSKAEECFDKLNSVKDSNIFSTLAQLLDEVTIKIAQATRDNFLRKMGDRHPHFGFLRLLSTKCLFNIFSSEHVHCILDHLLGDNFTNKSLEDSSVKLLLAIISAFPSLLRGSEKLFQLLLQQDMPFNEELIQMLAKAGPHIDIKLSDIYPSLERVCLEGTRAQSKLAVSAVAALIDTSELFFFSELCKTLVDALHGGQNIPTVLQALGCLAQHSVSTFESRDGEITQYIVEFFFQSADVETSNYQDLLDETSDCSVLCKLKIFGLKALVKSFLPHRPTHVSRDINQLLDVLSQMLQPGYISDGIISCESDKANIRLAAAKSVLRLSRRWDLYIPPEIFRFTIWMAKDSSTFARRLFIDKTHKLLKQHAVPTKYACAFAFAASDSVKDLRDDSLKYMAEFVREYSRDARIRQTSGKQLGLPDYPAYIVVFLIHVLAHDSGFPPENCGDEEIYAQFFSPLVFTLQAFVNASFVDGDMDVVNAAVLCLQSIFLAIKRAEDAVDAHTTPKLHILADFGISILNALNHSAITASHTLGLILLPSSLYRISPAEKRDEANSICQAWCPFNAKLANRVVPSFESQISRPASTLVKRGRKSQEDVSQSDFMKCSTANLVLCKNNDLLVNGTRERSESSFACEKKTHETLNQEINPRGRHKRALSPSPPGSVELHNEFSIYDEHEKGASGNSEPLIGRGHLPSSCDSVTTKPSLTEKEALKSSLIVNGVVTKSDSVGAETSKIKRVAGFCGLKDVGNNSQVCVGQRIKLWSPVDKCYHLGTVSGFDSTSDTHKITYDNGEVEVFSLETENWETISNDFLQEKELDSFTSQHCDFVNSQTKMVDALPDGVCQTKNFQSKGTSFSKRRISMPVSGHAKAFTLPTLKLYYSVELMNDGIISEWWAKKHKHFYEGGKENKRHKVSMDTSTSEVINVNEEAERQSKKQIGTGRRVGDLYVIVRRTRRRK